LSISRLRNETASILWKNVVFSCALALCDNAEYGSFSLIKHSLLRVEMEN